MVRTRPANGTNGMRRTKESPSPTPMRRTKNGDGQELLTGSRMGRPRTIPSPESFDDLVDLYIERQAYLLKPVTWTGMALALGFVNRQSMNDYEKRAEFSGSVKRARALVENAYEEALWHSSGGSQAGFIFALKNFGWTDRREVAATWEGRSEVTVLHKIDWSQVDDGVLGQLVHAMVPMTQKPELEDKKVATRH